MLTMDDATFSCGLFKGELLTTLYIFLSFFLSCFFSVWCQDFCSWGEQISYSKAGGAGVGKSRAYSTVLPPSSHTYSVLQPIQPKFRPSSFFEEGWKKSYFQNCVKNRRSRVASERYVDKETRRTRKKSPCNFKVYKWKFLPNLYCARPCRYYERWRRQMIRKLNTAVV